MSTTVVEFENQDIVVEMSGRGPIGPRGRQGEPGSAGPSEWGVIQGNISDQTDLQNALDAKANVGVSYTKAEDDALLAQKADADSVYTKTETDSLLSDKADADDVYSKTEVNTLLSGKADSDTVYTKTETDTLLDAKADVGDSYTKTEEDALLAVKANSADVYTKTETDTLLADKADSADVYTKDETDTLLTDKAPVILSNASGSIASFSDGSPAPVIALSVSIEPVQDLHGYDNPWPAGGGKNLFNKNMTYTTGGFLASDGTLVSNNDWSITDYIPVYGTTFTLSNVGGISPAICLYDADKNFITGKSYNTSGLQTLANVTITSQTIASYARFSVHKAQDTSIMQLESGSSSTSYAPYSNICPISGHDEATVTRTGKNLCPLLEWEPGQYENSNWSKTATTRITSPFISIEPNVVYTMSIDQNGTAGFGWINYNYFDKDKNWLGNRITNGDASISGQTVTSISISNENAQYIRITARRVPDGSTAISAQEIIAGTPQLELGSIATTYEPYQGQQVTIDLDGTRYGGVLNVMTGTMTVTKAMITKNTANMNNLQNYPGWKGSGVKAIIGSGKNTPLTIISNVGTSVNVNTETSNDIIFLSKAVYGKTQDEWIALAMDVQMVFDYATPLTVQLTPSQLSTLLGQNNIWADTGDVAVEYRADTKLYIDGKFSQLQALILEN